MKARLFGLALVAIAIGAAWWSVFLPLQKAVAQEPHVTYSIKGFVLAGFAAVFGLFFLIFGGSVPYRHVERQSPTGAGWVLLAASVLASGFCFWWAESRFEALGYAYSGASPAPRATPFVMPPIPEPPPQPVYPGAR